MKKLIVIAALVFAAMTARAQYSDSWVTGKTTQGGVEVTPYLFAKVPPKQKGAIRDDVYFGSAAVPPGERIFSHIKDVTRDSLGRDGYILENGQIVWITWEYRDGRPWQAAKVECNDITITRSW